jgi:hypothetical protein
MTERRNYGYGTYLVHQMPWSTYVRGAAMCSDGKVRTLKRIFGWYDGEFFLWSNEDWQEVC